MSTGDQIEAVSAVVGAIALVYAAVTFHRSMAVTRAQFTLDIFDRMERFNAVHVRFTHGDWSSDQHPAFNAKERGQIGRMLGLYEHIYGLYRDGILSDSSIDHLFSYRLFHMYRNKQVREWVHRDAIGWAEVLALVEALWYRPVFKSLRTKHGLETPPWTSRFEP